MSIVVKKNEGTMVTPDRTRFGAVVLMIALTVSGFALSGCAPQVPGPQPSAPTVVVPSHSPVNSTTTPTPEPLGPAHDSGPQGHAEGTAEAKATGEYQYVIASGDTVLGIAGRFGLCVADIYAGNDAIQASDELRVGNTLIVEREDVSGHDKKSCLDPNAH
jgi:LysM repeat protein